MTSVKFVILGLLVLAMSFLCLLLANLVGEKFLGLGDPIVYDSHSLWGYSPRASKQYIRFNSQIVTINNVGARGN